MLRLDARAVVAVGDEAHLHLRLRILVLLPVFFNQSRRIGKHHKRLRPPTARGRRIDPLLHTLLD